jgi:hypothetical protein
MPFFESEKFLAPGKISKMKDYPFSDVRDVSSQLPFVPGVRVLNL